MLPKRAKWIFLFVLLCLIVSSASAWLAGYNYRQLHNITGDASWSGDLSNYQVMFVVDTGAGVSSGNTIYLNSHSEADLDDLRFTSTSDTLYDYWIESTSSPYYVWVEIPTIYKSSVTQLYAYYGNGSVSAYSNGTNTFNFYDHFEGSSLSALWSVASGSASVGSSLVSITSGDIRTTSTFTDGYSTYARANMTRTTVTLVGTSDRVTDDYNARFITDVTGADSYGAQCEPHQSDLGTSYTGFHRWDIKRISSSSTKFYIDDSIKWDTSAAPSTTALNGRIYGGTIEADWFIIKKAVNPEPAHSTWFAEDCSACAPVAAFSANVTSGNAPLWVGFTDSSTHTPTSWYWEFGDGGNSTSQNPIHEYTAAGTYTVNLSATNAVGSDWENKTDYITVTADPPVAGFTGAPTSGYSPSVIVSFTDSSTNSPTSWYWEFGDTTTSNSQNPSHEYTVVGTYSVNHSSTNAYGTDWENKTSYIEVLSPGSHPPSAAFSANVTNGAPPLWVGFTGPDNDPMGYISQIGTEGSGNDQFDHPERTATDDTYLWVADTHNHRVVKRWASDLSYISSASGSVNDDPSGVATDGTYIWVADHWLHKIVKRWAGNLTFISESDGAGTTYVIAGPKGIATDGTFLWVADMENNSIVKFSATDLSFVSCVKGYGTGDNQFSGPEGIALAGSYIYVADTDNNRIMKRLASDLSYVSKIGTHGSGDDQFDAPCDIASDGVYVWVADTDNSRIVKRLVSDLSYCTKIGSYGSGDDQFAYPYGVCVDSTGSYLWITDTYNFRIVKRNAGGEIISWDWDFGDGNVSTTQNPVNEYNIPGYHTVKLKTTNCLEYTWENKTNYIYVNESIPVADFTSNITEGYPAFNVQFNDTSTNSPTDWYWMFGDGETSSDQNPIHTYDSVIGNSVTTYDVYLNASNGAGYDWENKSAHITAYPLEAGFTANVTNGCTPLWVGFTDGTINGTATNWSWDFGDGNTSFDQNPVHEYSTVGVYDVKLNVSNSYSYSWDNVTGMINTSAGVAVVAGFGANVTGGAPPLWVGFTDSSSGASSWFWDFGDGSNSTLQNPVHEYASSGVYTVSLNVSNSCGYDWENKTEYIEVGEIQIWWNKDSYSIGETATVSWSIPNWSLLSNNNFYAIVSTVADPTTTIQEEIITTQTGSFTVSLLSGLYSEDDYRVTLYGYNITSGIWVEAIDHADWSNRHGFCTLSYDNKMWVLGGYTGGGIGELNDVWYSTNGTLWTEANASCAWSVRDEFAATVYDNKMWVMGGWAKSDVWYSTDGITWTEATADAGWKDRYSHDAITYDGKMWVMGGIRQEDPIGESNDVWYSTDGILWTEATPHAGWADRTYFNLLVYDNKMWVMGGYNTHTLAVYNDVWYSTDGANWVEANSSAGWTERLMGAGTTTFSRGMLLFGGEDFYGCGGHCTQRLNDTWYSLDGETWTYIKDAEWNKRWIFGSLFYDNKTWVMGGGVEPFPSSEENDVWYLNEPVISDLAHDDMTIISINETIPKFPPHSVRFVLQDYFGTPLTDVWVYATPIETTLGSWSWLGGLFGMNITETNYVNTTMNGSTGLDGSIDFIMYPTIKYNITCVGGTYGIYYQTAIYPQENEIYLHIPTLNAPNTSSSVTYTTINSSFTPDAVGGVPGLNQWLALGTLLLVGTMFSKRSVKVAAVIVPLFGLFFYYIDWLEMNTMGLSILVSLLALGLLSYIRKAETVIGSK